MKIFGARNNSFDDSLESEIEHQLVVSLANHIWTVFGAHAVMIVVNTLFYWDKISTPLIATWFILMMSVSITRAVVTKGFKLYENNKKQVKSLERWHFGSVVLSGLGWTFFFSYTATHIGLHGVFLVFLSLSGLAGGSVSTLTASRLGFIAFICCLMLPSCVVVFMMGDLEGTIIAAVSVMYALVLISSGGKINGTLRDNLRMGAVLAKEKDKAEKLAEELQVLSTTDALTGISNRRVFDQFIEVEWGRALREGSPLSMILCDLDYFKPYNDICGHQKGDQCLRKVARIFSIHTKRSTDVVARYGGEEFVFILPGLTQDEAKQFGEELCHAVENAKIPHPKSKVSQFVTISMGVAQKTESDINPQFFIKRADEALYQAKAEGRNTVCIL